MDLGDGGREDAPTDDGDAREPSLERLVDAVEERRQGSSSRSSGWQEAGEVDDHAGPASPDRTRPSGSTSTDEHAAPYSTDTRTEAIVELVGEASNVLLLGPLLGPADYDLCTGLSAAQPGGTDNLLLVTLTESPDERLAVFQGYLDSLPRRTVVLNVGDSTRSESTGTLSTGEDGSVTVETISDPTDLMRIGIATSKLLSTWEETGGRTAVCFHSLTALLQYAEDPKVVFRFVHTLLGRLDSAGASAHFHMDSNAHEPQLVGTFRPIFDEVLTFEADGTVNVEH